jgi:hypothetical protein
VLSREEVACLESLEASLKNRSLTGRADRMYDKLTV